MGDTFVMVGRFQPMHLNHLELIKKIVGSPEFDKKRDELIIIIGSADCSREPRNPFTWRERRDMIASAIFDSVKGCTVKIDHIDDYADYMEWVDRIKKITGRNKATICGNEDVDFYARLLGYRPMLIPLKSEIHATDIRKEMARKGKIPHVPDAVRRWLLKNHGIRIVRESLEK